MADTTADGRGTDETATSDVATKPGRRRYRSPLRERRAAETRTALLQAARRLFVAKGWAGTGMRDVASEAGVAIETVYAHFSSKRGLLRAVMDVAVVGDDAPVGVAERPEFEAVGRGTRSERVRAAARLLVGLNERTAGFAKVIREAAPTDPELADELRDTRARQRLDVARGVELIIGRPPTDVERDTVWTITSPEVYLLLVEESAWSLDQYEGWLAEMFDRLLPRS